MPIHTFTRRHFNTTGAGTVITGDQPSGFTVPAGETWTLEGTVTTPANVIVEGTLRMRSGATLRFRDVNEASYVGGDTAVVQATDVGLWFIGEGKLDAVGTAKTPWTRATGAISAGATSFTVNDATGWQVGDEIVITPTVPRSVANFWTKHDERTITGVSGNTITVNSPLTNAHPTTTFSSTTYTAEVLNLTRDVVIEGTPGGRAHVIFLHQEMETLQQSSSSYVELRHLGPAGSFGGVSGRYALHFHHAGETTDGITMEGLVAHDCGNHAFVSHNANGITWDRCIAHDVTEIPFWWDPEQSSDRVVYDTCVASKVQVFAGVERFKGSGFFLNKTTEDLTSKCINCVSTGIDSTGDSNGYLWDNASVGVWTMDNCLSHNIRHLGILVWQNVSSQHPVNFYHAYACGESGIRHGAYSNRYHYHDLKITDCGIGIDVHAVSRFTADAWGGQEWHRVLISNCPTPIRLGDAAVNSETPTEFLDCEFASAEILCEAIHSGQTKHWDMTDCGIDNTNVTQTVVNPTMRLRTQNGSPAVAWQLTDSGIWESIDPF